MKKIKKVLSAIMLFFISIGTKTFAGTYVDFNSLKSMYGVEKPSTMYSEPTFLEKILKILLSPITILLVILIGIFVFCKKKNISQNIKIYILVVWIIILGIVIAFFV